MSNRYPRPFDWKKVSGVSYSLFLKKEGRVFFEIQEYFTVTSLRKSHE